MSDAPRILPGDTKVVNVDTLKEHPENYRHGDVGAIAESLGAHGQYRPVLVQASTGFVIAGNHTLKAARATGMVAIEARVIDVDDEEALRILIGDNRTSDLATNDDRALSEMLVRLAKETERGLAGTGWDGTDLDVLLQDVNYRESWKASVESEAEVPESEVPGLVEKYEPALGQTWVAHGDGRDHRLAIGDCGDPAVVASACDGRPVDFVFTSPPYNVGVDYLDHDDKPVQWSDYRTFLVAAMRASVDAMAQGRVLAWNIGPAPRTFPYRQMVMLEDDLGLTFYRQYVWDKGQEMTPLWATWQANAQVRRNPGGYSHEFVSLFVKGQADPERGAALAVLPEHELLHRDVVSIRAQENNPDVIVGDQPIGTSGWQGMVRRRNTAHPAKFPQRLPLAWVNVFAGFDEVVLDPFVGSGTTILAAEQTGRVGAGIEISPRYAAVTLERLARAGMSVERMVNP